MSVSLTNSEDWVANSISVIANNRVIDVKEPCVSKLDAMHSIAGLPVSTLNSLQQPAEAINSDANLFNNSMTAVKLKTRFNTC